MRYVTLVFMQSYPEASIEIRSLGLVEVHNAFHRVGIHVPAVGRLKGRTESIDIHNSSIGNARIAFFLGPRNEYLSLGESVVKTPAIFCRSDKPHFVEQYSQTDIKKTNLEMADI